MNTQTSYFKKALVVLMAVMMVFTMMPGMAWATDETETSSNESSEGNIASGNCGAESNKDGAKSVTWELSTDGTLTISGTGAMEEYWYIDEDYDPRPWSSHVDKITKIVIGDGVTNVASNAFNGCKSLKDAVLGSSVTTIEGEAFYDCSGLSSIQLPDSLTEIWPNAFGNCIGLKSITIPRNVTSTGVGRDAFKGCTHLETLVLNNVVTEDNLPTAYIDGCLALTKIEIKNDESTVKYEDGIFYSKDGETLVRCLPSKTGNLEVPNTVKTIKEDAFKKCSALEKLILPETIKTAYNGILFNCSSLRYVELKGVTEVVRFAFENCTALDQLVLPACLTSYAETSVAPKLICFRGSEEQWEAAATEKVRTKLADKGTVVVYNYDDQAGVSATITAQPEQNVEIGLGQTKYLSVAVNEEAGTQYYLSLIHIWCLFQGYGKSISSEKAIREQRQCSSSNI